MASGTPCRAGPDAHFNSRALREKGGSLSRGIETERSEEARPFFPRDYRRSPLQFVAYFTSERGKVVDCRL